MKNGAAKLKKALGGYSKKSVHAYIKAMDDEYAAKENELKTKSSELQQKLNQLEETISTLNESEETKKTQISILSNQIENLTEELTSAKNESNKLSDEIEALKTELQNRPPLQDNQAETDALNNEIERLKLSNAELTSALEAARGNARFVSELEDSLDELIECIRESADKIKADAQQEAETIIQNARERARSIEIDRLRSNGDSASRILAKLARFRDALIK